jgi:phosphatidylserine/phosphatidylglycerophosphate/cardiolipin synthase-like enzyme
MSTSIIGTLISETGQPLPRLHVVIRDESAIFPSVVGETDSDNNGAFTVNYGADLTPELGTRKLVCYVTTQMGRQLLQISKDDVASAVLTLGNVTIKQAETTGYVVTLGGSGQAASVRDGNAVRPLIDDQDAWSYLKDKMRGAQASINLMELEFDIPPQYNAAPDQEDPEIVFSFGQPVDPANPRPVTNADDFRPERILLDQSSHGVKVRISVPHHNLAPITPGTIALELLVFLLFLAVLPLGIYGLVRALPYLRSAARLQNYFAAATSNAQFASFATTPFNVVHAKAALFDDLAAVVIGSPFSQSYWDTHQHPIFEPQRGSASGEPVPVHDVSLAIRGPAVKDLHDAFRLHWNFVKPNDLAEIAVPAAIATPDQDEYIASVQLVRTLNGGVFPAPLDQGEQGNLEAYLRAIEQAKTYIYLENQYFTCDAICKALVAALNDTARPALQVIVLLNVTPDMPLYPGWQSDRIKQIRKDAGANVSRIEFFTAWSHDPPFPSQNRTKPMIAPNYVHTKVGIVDDAWASVGSANLDGASLDYFQFLHALQFANNRNHELNYLIFNNVVSNVDGRQLPQTDAVATLRRNLWSEHLAIDANDAQLALTNAAAWIGLWRTTAEKKRSALANSPATINPANGRILQCPPNAPGKAKDYLKASQITLDNLDLIAHVQPFNFHTGKWQ